MNRNELERSSYGYFVLKTLLPRIYLFFSEANKKKVNIKCSVLYSVVKIYRIFTYIVINKNRSCL